jgi:hypothetical protein
MMMVSPIQVTHEWNQAYWPTEGAERAYLLMKLTGTSSEAAHHVRLTLYPTEGFALRQVFGYSSEQGAEKLSIQLGVLEPQKEYEVVLECSLAPHSAGVHEVMQIEWECTDPRNDAQVKGKYGAAAVFSGDESRFRSSCVVPSDENVSETDLAAAIAHAVRALLWGDDQTGRRLLQRQADTLLCRAIRTADSDLYEKAVLLYDQLERWDSSDPTN